MNHHLLVFTFFCLAGLGLPAAAPSPLLVSYNVVWDSPSPDAWESMPLSGRLGAGANVWVQDGSLWLYLAHNAAYDENGRLLKLGCLRLTPADGLLAAPASFRQELDLRSGAIRIDTTAQDGRTLRLKLWFAGENLVIKSAAKSATAFTVQFGTWRDVTREGLFLDIGKRQHTVRADRVEPRDQALLWFHRNADYPSSLDAELAKQPFAVGQVTDPTKNNLFGGAFVCDRPLTAGPSETVQWQKWTGRAWTLTAAPAKTHTFVAALRAAQNAQPESWLDEARGLLARSALKAAAHDEQKRWDEFWSRSHIVINPAASSAAPSSVPTDKPWLVGRNYQLFRYMLACNRGGKFPLIFNGGIFTTDNFGKISGNNNDEMINRKPIGPSTPDLRHWMYCGLWPRTSAGSAGPPSLPATPICSSRPPPSTACTPPPPPPAPAPSAPRA